MGRKAEILTGRQSNMEKVEECNSNPIEESTYRVSFAYFKLNNSISPPEAKHMSPGQTKTGGDKNNCT